VPLPDKYYRYTEAFIVSKISPYKRLINWRWDNKIESIRYIIDNLRILWIPCKMPKRVSNFHLLSDTSDSAEEGGTTGLYHFSKVLHATGQHFQLGIDTLELLGICD
jgi:hypothetical protein